jgi:hypothetical protein
MEQTAVEWLAEQFDSIVELYPSQFEKINNAITQAKEMEKQQIIDACYFAYNEGCSYMSDGSTEYESFEQYYEETYNKKI